MAFFDFLNPIFDFLFGWLLNLTPFWAIMLLSLLMALIIVFITKYTTDQDLMKRLKEEQKTLQKEMKELKKDPEKMMHVQKKAMQANMKYMTQSFRPMIFTLIPILIIFGWIQGHLALEPIMPGQEFSVKIDFYKGIEGSITANAPEGIQLTSDATKEITDGNAIFTFKGAGGLYTSPGIDFTVNDKTYVQEVEITKERSYLNPINSIRDKTVKNIDTVHEKVRVINLGFVNLTWIWSYILFSIVFSTVLRKWLKVY